MSVKDLIILGCSSQQPTRQRNHGAYLLRWNNQGFLFDPGEGTQRQFIFANVKPTVVNRIFISHFHGDHCLGFGSFLMRLNLDNVTHPIHCYYPASGKKYFDRLRFGTMYHDRMNVIEHPISTEGLVHEDDDFLIEAFFLKHGVDNLAYRVSEKDRLRFDKEKLEKAGIVSQKMRQLIDNKEVKIEGRVHHIDDYSYFQKGDVFSYVMDTLLCKGAYSAAKDAKMLLCESTYLNSEEKLAIKHHHLTASQAAQIAKKSNVKQLILTHFSARYLDLRLFEKEAREIFPNTQVADDLKQFSFK